MAITWDTVNSCNTYVFSGSNLIATVGAGGINVAFSNTALPTGKSYFELTPNISSNNSWVGLVDQTFVSSIAPCGIGGSNAHTASWWFFASFNGIYVNNVQQSSANNTWTTSGVAMQVAVDTVAKLAWVQQKTGGHGWNSSGTADPLTGVGGIDISALTFPLYAAVALTHAGGADNCGYAPNLPFWPVTAFQTAVPVIACCS